MDIPVFANVRIELAEYVATVEFTAGSANFLSLEVMQQLAAAWDWADAEAACRSVVLCSTGSVFCAGVNLTSLAGAGPERSPEQIYLLGLHLLKGRKPVIAAIQGAAVGAGLGLAMLADQRVAGPRARFNASFVRLGFNAGFGLTATLPYAIGARLATRMLLAGQPIDAQEAVRLGLADEAVDDDGVRAAAQARARVIAGNAPRVVQDMRQALREPLIEEFRKAIEREWALQRSHMSTDDFREGISAMLAKRDPRFVGT
jgi:enoyl-CoA hydratase/carnithine racemase